MNLPHLIICLSTTLLLISCQSSIENNTKPEQATSEIRTRKIEWAKNLKLEEFKSSECLENCDLNKYQNNLVQKTLKDDILYLKIGVIKNCCIEFTPQVYKNQNYLEIYTDTRNGITEKCACDCAYDIELYISSVIDTSFSILLDWEPIH